MCWIKLRHWILKIDTILKWIATAVLVVGTAVNSLGYYPEGPLILALGGYIWLVVSIMWKDWALIATNIIMSTTGLVLTLINLS
jgi:hypothetical protein